MTYDYFYGGQSESFSFYRIPRQLITGEEFRNLSTDAKLLYGLMLDRMGLSARNGWYDELDRVYIYYTVEEITEDLCCGHNKAVRLLAELDTKGVGLIERKKQGQGKPTMIYVKQFVETAPTMPRGKSASPRLPKMKPQDFPKPEVQASRKGKQVIRIIIKLILAILIHLSIPRTIVRSRRACGSKSIIPCWHRAIPTTIPIVCWN